MPVIEWKKKYEIGHSRIDFEHQIFVDLIAKIYDATNEGGDKEYIKRLMNELRQYAEFHFISEENIMYSVKYPDYDQHVNHHNELLERFSEKIMEIELGDSAIGEFLEFLLEWFVHHTLNEDKKIARYIKDTGV